MGTKTTSINHDAELKLLKNQLEQLANDSEKKDAELKRSKNQLEQLTNDSEKKDAELKLSKNQLEQLANDSEKKDGHTKHELELLKAEIEDANATTASKLDHHDNAIDDLYSKQQSQQEQQEEEKQKLLVPQKDELDRKDIAPVESNDTKVIPETDEVEKSVAENTDVASHAILAWIVLYAEVKGRPEIKTLFESYEMFHNKDVYQKILIVWDSAQDGSIEILDTLGKTAADDIITIDLTSEIDLDLEKEQFEPKHRRNHCFGRGPGYCQMLYNKMLVDVFASA